jgi:predicted DNA-binding transcriptional regulator AlpA
VQRTAELLQMFRTTERAFRRIRRTRGLTLRDKEGLEDFYIDHVFAPETGRIIRSSAAGTAVPPRMLTAKDLEAWLEIDRKTIYSYVLRKLIPHVRIESNVRFVEAEIRCWLERHHYRPKKQRTNSTRSQIPAAPVKLTEKPSAPSCRRRRTTTSPRTSGNHDHHHPKPPSSGFFCPTTLPGHADSKYCRGAESSAWAEASNG